MKHKQFYIAEFGVSRHYGGPEEGGWWYDWYELVNVRIFKNKRAARRTHRRLMRKAIKPKYNRYSVLGGTDTLFYRTSNRQEIIDLISTRRPRYE